MNDADREACLQWFESDKVNDQGLLVELVLSAWQAACEWRDSQVEEPKAWGNLSEDFADSERVLITNEVDAKKYHEQVYNLTPLFTTPPTAQINEQMREALEFFVDRFEPMRNELIFSKRLAIDKAKAALDAATPK